MRQYLYNDPSLKELRRILRKKQTPAERLIWSKLRNRQIMNHKFYRQYSVGRYILDFYCPAVRLAVELDGGHHNEAVHQQLDAVRTDYLNANNIKVIRFWNREVTDNLAGVLQEIAEATTPSISLLQKRERHYRAVQ